MTREKEQWLEPEVINWTQILLDNYYRLLGKELISRTENIQQQSESLFKAPFVVVSHGTGSDPILNYGNQTALELWQISWQEFTKTPSRLTAESLEREKRQEMLTQADRNGFIANYAGVRIASNGQRFLIEKAIVWNLVGEKGVKLGQAATFSEWSFI